MEPLNSDKEDAAKHWAVSPPDEFAPLVMDRWRDWRQYYNGSGLAEQAVKGHRYYYGLNQLGESAARLNPGRASVIKMVINKIRQVVQRSLAMVSSRAPKIQPVSANSDAAARQDTISARGILDHVHREHDTEDLDTGALETALVMGEAMRLILWDPNKGEPLAIDPETEEPAETGGDFANHILTPFDTARDPSYPSWKECPWVITKTKHDRYELAALYPEKATEIIGASDAGFADALEGQLIGAQPSGKGDAISVFHFFHLPTRAVPGGRAFACLNDATWLYDGPNPYNRLPVARCTPGKVIGSSLAYSNVFDALGCADMLNAMFSAFATNTTRWGVGTLLVADDSNIQPSTMANGMGMLKYSWKEGRPAPGVLQPPQTPPEAYKHAEMLNAHIEASLGMNGTAMGIPAFSGMAASMAALLDQKAQEFHDSLSKSWASYKGDCVNMEIHALKTFAEDPRIATIQGKGRRWMLRKFTGADFANIARVAVETVPAGTGTQAYKWAMLETLGKFGVKLKPDQVIDFMNTGQIDSQFEAEQNNVLRIQIENEGLMRGERPPTFALGTPWVDIPEHFGLLSNPDVLERPEVVAAILETIQVKLARYKAMDPVLVAMFGGPQISEFYGGMPPMPLPPGDSEPEGGAAPAAPMPPGPAPTGFADVPLPVPPQPPGGP